MEEHTKEKGRPASSSLLTVKGKGGKMP